MEEHKVTLSNGQYLIKQALYKITTKDRIYLTQYTTDILTSLLTECNKYGDKLTVECLMETEYVKKEPKSEKITFQNTTQLEEREEDDEK